MIIVLIYSLYYTALVVLLLYASKKLKKQRSGYKPFISVIIAARNEENLIGRCLENLQKQTYDKSKFEVIVVNDRSQDRTPEIVLEFQKKHGIFRLINIKEVPLGTSPKKYSLSNGIEKARGQIIVTTDADSIVPVAWLERISNYIGEELTLVLGFVYIHPDSSLNNFLGTFDSLELFAFSTVSAFSTGLSFPISANSSNMAYSRKLFNTVNGYNSVKNIISGDDELLLDSVFKKRTAAIKFIFEREA
ncbi:MAG: glycosyltransferase, partial [Elusimicrobiota bacterium]